MFIIMLVCMGCPSAHAQSGGYDWTLFAGSKYAASGSTDGTGTSARFDGIGDIAVDPAGSLYVADTYNSTIRKVTPDGLVTTLAGTPTKTFPGPDGGRDGLGSAARFWRPMGITLDYEGNLYVRDFYGLRKITPAGAVTTRAISVYISAFAFDATGNLFDACCYVIRKITPDGQVTVFAGSLGEQGSTDGTGSEARFGPDDIRFQSDSPRALALDGAGNIYAADTPNKTIRRVTSDGVVTTFAGSVGNYGSTDGPGSEASFKEPRAMAMDGRGNLLVVDSTRVRKVSPDGIVTTVSSPTQVDSRWPAPPGNGDWGVYLGGVAVTTDGTLFVAELANNRIWKGTPAHLKVLTPSLLPSCVMNAPCDLLLTATNGTPPYLWSVVSNALPNLMTLTSSGALTGAPTTVQVSEFRVRVVDASNQVAEANLRLEVLQPPVALDSKDTLLLAESQSDAKVCHGSGEERDCDVIASGSSTVKAALFAGHPIDAAGLDGNTSVRITLGRWSFSSVLGQAHKYVAGAKSATFVLLHEECDSKGDHCKMKRHGQLALKFTPKGVALALTFKNGATKFLNPMEAAILADAHRTSAGVFSDNITASVQIGSSITLVPVSITGVTQFKDVGNGDNVSGLTIVKLKGNIVSSP